MIKYLIAISLLAGCWDKHCDAPGKPVFPAIGGCLQNALQGELGGTCNAGGGCNGALQCVGGICYECGNAGNPPQPCCGAQATYDHGTCYTGTCMLDTSGDGWYACVGGVSTPPNCDLGAKPNYTVWTLDAKCNKSSATFCAEDDAAAQAFVDANFANVVHGAPSTDPHATEPQPWYVCATGDNCVVGSSDESKVTTIYAFDHDQVVACEAFIDSNCTWVDGGQDMCPAQP